MGQAATSSRAACRVRGRLVDVGIDVCLDQPVVLGRQKFRLAGDDFDRIALLVEDEGVARQRADRRDRKVVGRQAAPAVGVPDDFCRGGPVLIDEKVHSPRLGLEPLERDPAALAPPAVLVCALLPGAASMRPFSSSPRIHARRRYGPATAFFLRLGFFLLASYAICSIPRNAYSHRETGVTSDASVVVPRSS